MVRRFAGRRGEEQRTLGLPYGRPLTRADLQTLPDDGHRYEEAGTASYWVVDPIELTLTAWDLVDGHFVEVATVSGDEEHAAERPFPVTIRPGRLRD